MQRSRQHMAVVVDEHGSSAGVITLENILERVVGAIQDEYDAETPGIISASGGSYLVRGAVPLQEINRELDTEFRAPHVNTLSGYRTAQIGRFPEVGGVVELPGITAKVLELDGNVASNVQLKPSRKKRTDT